MSTRTSEQHATAPLGCPVCGADCNSVQGESVEIEGRSATQEVYCMGCGSSWSDVYTLSGYVDLVSDSTSLAERGLM